MSLVDRTVCPRPLPANLIPQLEELIKGHHICTSIMSSSFIGFLPEAPTFLYTKLPKATYQNLVPGIQGSIDDYQQGFISEFDRDFERTYTFSGQSENLSLKNDDRQAKKISRLFD